MKHFYSQIKNFINIALFLGIFLQSYVGNSQTTLAAGDLIFTGYDANFSQTDGGDVFSFVLLVNISAGTIINFTDRGYFLSSTWQANSASEGTISWTSPTALAAGTEVIIKGLTVSTYNLATGTPIANATATLKEGTMTNGLNLSSFGDQIIAFQNGGGSPTGAGATMISGLHFYYCPSTPVATTQIDWDAANCANGTTGSKMPPGLVGGTSAFYTGPNTPATPTSPSAAKFNLNSGASINTIAEVRAAVMNPANWTLSAATIIMPSAAPFLATPPTITANPPNRTVCPAGNTTFPITAANASSYKWQVNTGSGFTDLSNGAPYSGVTTATLSLTGITTTMNGYTYRCVATGAGSVNSNSATLSVPNTIVITTAQSNVSCNGGNNGSATIAASGGFTPYSYSWLPSGGTAATATNLTAQTYTVTVTDAIGCSTPHTVIITEPTLAASSPSISTQPASYSACTGSTATFTVAATNTVTYQWQVDDGSGYNNITNGGTSPNYLGSNTASLTISSITSGMNGYSYRVVLTSACSNTIASNGLSQLNVTSLPVATATPASATICSGVSPNITLTSTPPGATFSWTVATTSGTVSGASASSGTSINQTLSGNGIVTYTVTPSLNSCPGTPITIPVTVNPLPAITAQPSGSTICAGANTTFSATVSNATGYQWQVNQGLGFVNVGTGAPYSGTTTTTLTITGATAALNGYVYRLIATGTCTPNVVTNAATLTINSAPSITAQPSSSTICTGANTTFSVSASSATGYQWQVDQGAGFSTVSNIAPYSGATTATLTITGATAALNGYLYRAIAIGACTPDASSNGASLTVNSAPAITTQPSNSITCLGTNTTFTVAASNATGYQWQVDQGAGFSNVPNIAPYSGATTATLTITGATASMNGYVYRAIATGSCTPSAVSSARTLTIPIIVANQTQTNVSCNGGTNGVATVAPTGGSGSYTYLWSNNATTASITGLQAGTYSVTIKDGNLCEKLQSFTISQPPALVASEGSVNNVSCFNGTNGSATVNVTGGAGTYTYSWAPTGGFGATASGLAQGNYIVTVKDANLCSTTQAFSITQPPAFSVTPSQTNLLCNGATTGSASVVVTGGTGTYNYSWSPTGGSGATATGLGAGTYIVTIEDSNSCSTTSSFTFLDPPALVLSQGPVTNVNCYGGSTGSATVIVTGGTGGHTYSWAPSGGNGATATGLSAGNYIVTVTDDNSCSKTLPITISGPSATLSASTTSTGVSCFGGSNGSASVTASGGTPLYTYLWAPLGGTGSSISGKPAGDYTCTITDSKGCSIVKTITISTPAAFSATYTKTDVSCNGGTNGSAAISATGGTGQYTYTWSPTGGNGATASGLAAGNYTVFVQDENTCSYSVSVSISQPPVLAATQAQTNVLCNGGNTGTATVVPTGGTLNYTYLWSPSGGTAATATGLATGNYSCLITDSKGCTVTKTFFISEPAILIASTSKIDATCVIGGQASVSVSGGVPAYTYLWSPSGLTTAIVTGLAAGNHSVIITDGNGCTLNKNFTINTTNTLTAVQSQTNVLCNGANTGSATVVPSGAPGPFTYVWAPTGGNAETASNLIAGNYSVTIASVNGCSIVKNFTIVEPSALVVTPIQINIACNGGFTGSASVNVTGGTGAYTYLWAPTGGTAATATGLSAGTYTVTIKDANLCQTTQSFTITEPAAIVATTSQTNVSCNGGTNGSATVSATGGTGTYTYTWSPTGGSAATASGLAAGTYNVVITDANSCTKTQSFTITEPAALAATTSKTDVSCNSANDGIATINVTGGTGAYTYSWSPSGGNAATASGLAPGTYIVTVNDANLCQITATVTIVEPAVLAATASQTNISCNGANNGSATVNVTGGTGAYTYLWSPTGGTAPTASGLAPGTYTVTIKDDNTCQTTQSFTITEPAAIVATTSQTNVSCKGATNGSATVNVTGGTGAYAYTWSPTGGSAATASGLAAGIYTVTITDDNSCSVTQNVTITEPAALAATTSKTDVSCSGAGDGTASVNVTGGTGVYTYSWSPSGGTAATASGLTPNTYTVSVTDANGCIITQIFTIITTPDVTAPVPTVATLPEITNYCAILASQIVIPTATDNCVGTVNGTTTDPLTYSAIGTYVITWKYVDASGNSTTQPQTLKVLASPLNAVTFSNAQFTFDGNAHPLQVANLPTGASVVYSANNTSVNAGTYTVTATVSPSVSSPNCAPVVLTANLVINKAAQLIAFDAIPVKTLGVNNTFNLTAVSNSGLPVDYTFTYVAALAPASVSTTGLVTMLRSGNVVITAHQAGNSNYLPATDVSQLLVILNNNIDVKRITLGTKVFDNPGKTIYHLLSCSETNPTVAIVNESNATITPSANFTIQTPKPGIYNQNVTITSQDGSASAVYAITIEKPFGFFDIVHQKFNNVLLVNNNPQTNGGYEFVSYQWFKNGQVIGTGQYYSAGNDLGSNLDPSADYSVKMTTKDGKVLQTCASKITLINTLQAKLYPNPIQTGKIITVEADFPKEELQNMQISLYSATGQLIKMVQSSSEKTEIQLPPTTESNMYLVVLETPNIKKSFKVIVK